MKNITIYILVCLFIIACFSNNVENVKNSSILPDGNVKIGAAFAQYLYFKKII